MKRFIKQAATLNGEKMTRLQYDASNGCTCGGGGNLTAHLSGVSQFDKCIKQCYISDMVHHKHGFTLAEVLITLGIIGIVAALTMPSLIANHKEKETVTRLKKAYSTLSNAYIGVLNEYGPPPDWNVESWDDVVVMFSKYIQNVRVCPLNEGGCFFSEVRKDLRNNKVDQMASMSSLVMSDGIVMGIGHQVNIGQALPCENLNYCFQFEVDINGNKRPNRWGEDTFTFIVTSDKVIPRGGKDTHGRQKMCDPSASSTSAGWYNGSGCAAWVIQAENLDYLKCVKGNQKYCNKDYYFN